MPASRSESSSRSRSTRSSDHTAKSQQTSKSQETGKQQQAEHDSQRLQRSPRIGEAHIVDIDQPTAVSREGKGEVRVVLPAPDRELPFYQKPLEALRLAQEAFTQTGYWVAFFRAILGPEGVVPQLFPTEPEREYFASTREYTEIHKMLAALRSSDTEKAEVVEPQKMLTIRIPKSLRAALVEEAKQRGVSMNKLVISKMLTPANPDFVPTEKGLVRGRKPKRGR
ncbi:toxin-antitoxin system HicB family antitoxin [Planctomycetaceae bacterium SH139]